MRVLIIGDKIAERFGQQLREIGDGKARRVISRGLNRGGHQAFVQVRRSLSKQTGIKAGMVKFATKERKSTPGSLTYSIVADGRETNLNLFGAKQLKKGVSASPWGKRRQFRKTFIVPQYGARVFKRLTQKRGPLDPLWGPNIAREIMKSPTVDHWDKATGYILNNIEHDLARLFSR